MTLYTLNTEHWYVVDGGVGGVDVVDVVAGAMVMVMVIVNGSCGSKSFKAGNLPHSRLFNDILVLLSLVEDGTKDWKPLLQTRILQFCQPRVSWCCLADTSATALLALPCPKPPPPFPAWKRSSCTLAGSHKEWLTFLARDIRTINKFVFRSSSHVRMARLETRRTRAWVFLRMSFLWSRNGQMNYSTGFSIICQSEYFAYANDFNCILFRRNFHCHTQTPFHAKSDHWLVFHVCVFPTFIITSKSRIPTQTLHLYWQLLRDSKVGSSAGGLIVSCCARNEKL